ncbi:MAG: hypothetical protein E6H05_12200 [Bacillati bacterium ANGP1]|uniref:Uncharacterized protein n=1 Tax=Candidatus Segetimicrobium genomatis TaxID=2569760 RepID=A0A537IK84_9BACT|nr:MAG: hypothetical protein E6H05_12200 [Terrabacteria group bacterium ANGP1]
MRLTAGAIAPTLQALIAMVGNGPETLVQPHLWPEERLVWCERPTSLGAVLAQVSYAYKKANAAVELFSAPLSLFVGLGWLIGITPVLIFVLWFPLGLGLAAVIVALVAAVATGLYGWHRARGTCYAITDRRVLAVRGVESDWTLHEAWDSARVAWQVGGIGSVAFSRSGEGDLDVRFVGVRSPTEIVEVVSGAALERRRQA